MAAWWVLNRRGARHSISASIFHFQQPAFGFQLSVLPVLPSLSAFFPFLSPVLMWHQGHVSLVAQQELLWEERLWLLLVFFMMEATS